MSVASFFMLAGCLFTLPQEAISAEKKNEWNLSCWGGKRAGTRPLHDYAADMEKKTNGGLKIKYCGVLKCLNPSGGRKIPPEVCSCCVKHNSPSPHRRIPSLKASLQAETTFFHPVSPNRL